MGGIDDDAAGRGDEEPGCAPTGCAGELGVGTEGAETDEGGAIPRAGGGGGGMSGLIVGAEGEPEESVSDKDGRKDDETALEDPEAGGGETGEAAPGDDASAGGDGADAGADGNGPRSVTDADMTDVEERAETSAPVFVDTETLPREPDTRDSLPSSQIVVDAISALSITNR
jgi:hypothetical protein